ncbi:hypothetical protein ACFFLZ_12220 [Photobacterium aphoticum]|uniref:Uncharacterized protein n=1 Tax=Photobacterium aphoticum TaxID=754436 RepID=A0A0J1GPH9_9GAMM|nr:hypothetical protein [Photobacterium aphoticum]KLV01536.1 hypothetical protein ABT58_07115 [Photobacterium aphoticum]PSU54908.1 hypothetical protein C9I90_18460 [Photobacterium aphoticum]GHA43232.1 hypothetical protein GCM10007086_15930 [Photobacterium aphoticum]
MYDKLMKDMQLDYDSTLYDLEYSMAIKEKALIYKENLSLDNNNEQYINKFSVLIDKFVESKDLKIKHLNKILENQIERHNSNNIYVNYKDDVSENLDRLKKRQKKYKEVFYKSTLNILKDDGIPHHPSQWKLDDIEDIEPFIPLVTSECFGHEEYEDATTNLVEPKDFDYSNVVFRYADDTNDIIRNRFILYWDCDNECKTEKEAEISDGFHLGEVNVAYINDYGYAYKINIEGDGAIIKSKNKEGKIVFSLTKPIIPRNVYDIKGDVEKDKYYPYNHTETKVRFNRHGEILLYPLDQNSFTTKSISSISKIKVDGCSSATTKLNKLVYEVDEDTPPNSVSLHCTLPEWNHRLKTEINFLKRQLNQYKLLCHPHLINLHYLSEMDKILDWHIKYPYISSFDHKQRNDPTADVKAAFFGLPPFEKKKSPFVDEMEMRYQLKDSIVSLTNSIQSIIEEPEQSTLTFGLAIQKNHLERSSKKLFELVTSPLLKAEINRYRDSAKKHFSDGYTIEGIMPPGPYMEKEEHWDQIFITISECYALLSQSTKFRLKIWDAEIKHGFDALGGFDREEIADNAVFEKWDREKDTEYLSHQAISLQDNIVMDQTITSVFKGIIEDYEVYAKSYLGYIVPGPGAPCMLQVALNCFQLELETLFLERARDNLVKGGRTYHIRVYLSVLKCMGLLGRDKKTEIINRVDDLFDGLIRKNQAYGHDNIRDINNRLNGRAKGAIARFYRNIDGNNGLNGWFYNKFSWDIDRVGDANNLQRLGSFAKTVYSIYNYAYAMQELLAVSEDSKKNGWDLLETSWEYTTRLANLLVATGALTVTVANLIMSFRVQLNKYFSKNITPPPLTTARKLFGLFLDIGGVVISVFQIISSSIDLAKALKNGDGHAAFMAGANISANVLLVAGLSTKNTLLKMAGRSICRRAGYTFISAATGGLLLCIGSGITFALLAYELSKIIKDYTATEYQKNIIKYWSFFKEEKPISKELVSEYELLIDYEDKADEDLWGIATDSYDDGLSKVKTSYISDCYALYIEYWKEKKINGSENNPLLFIDEYHKEDLSSYSGIRLNYLSWRAIIPLYLTIDNKGERVYSLSKIKEMTRFDVDWMDKDNFNGIRTVEDVVKYYDGLVKIGKMKKEARVKRRGKYVLISDLLEVGEFTPSYSDEFYLDGCFDHDSFRLIY